MPIHDWTRVDAGLFHAFHQSWIVRLCDALNEGGLPQDYFALPEQTFRGPIPDVLALRLSTEGRLEEKAYARRADRVTIRHRHGEIVAVIEIVSPGNKSSDSALRTFVQKTSDLIEQGVHLLVIDLNPPTKRDPHGIHELIWDELEDEEFDFPADRPLILAAYEAGPDFVAYVEPVAVGDVLPDMPLFLRSGFYVPAPLEATYQTTWKAFPAPLKGLLEDDAASHSSEQP